MIKTTGTKIGDWIIAFICLILIAICLLPVMNILARSLSHPRPLIRSEVMLIPKDNAVEVTYENVFANGVKVTETAVIIHSIDVRTRRPVVETYIIRESVNEETGKVSVDAIPIVYLYDRLDFDRVEINEETGTALQTLEVSEIPFTNDFDEDTGEGTLIIQNAEILRLTPMGEYETYVNTQTGRTHVVTAVIRHIANSDGEIEETTYIIRETDEINSETGLPRLESVSIAQAFVGVNSPMVNKRTGTQIDSITIDGSMFTADFNAGTRIGTIILENAEVRRAATENVTVTGVDISHYISILQDNRYTWSLAWTAMLTVACAIWSVFMTAICAYPLTYDHLKGRKFFNTFIILTMYFNAGTVPTYILLKSLGLINHPLVLALPFCLSVFNMIIMRSYFYGIPLSLRESAELDGAGPIRTMVSIYLPLSMPVVATLLLFYAVGRWNGFSDALMFMNQNEFFYPIQLLLYYMIQGRTSPDVAVTEANQQLGASDALQTAMVMFAMIPILIVYPFLQRYFIAGVTLGAVKE
ncbi:MAG: carbohydrate ABC transporter permease [Oscillospiraceae bacterium]|jgi:putative aldouronate transport system permease protein|nr:carbohydrate ABC transporter permease [Oscillospiraceae bacterium]